MTAFSHLYVHESLLAYQSYSPCFLCSKLQNIVFYIHIVKVTAYSLLFTTFNQS